MYVLRTLEQNFTVKEEVKKRILCNWLNILIEDNFSAYITYNTFGHKGYLCYYSSSKTPHELEN